MACIKTGIVLEKRHEPTEDFLTYSYQQGGQATVYGDLHLVGNCAILYYPKDQVAHGKVDGWIDLNMGYDCFQRNTSPFHILVLPAARVSILQSKVYPTDWDIWKRAGGLLDERG